MKQLETMIGGTAGTQGRFINVSPFDGHRCDKRAHNAFEKSFANFWDKITGSYNHATDRNKMIDI